MYFTKNIFDEMLPRLLISYKKILVMLIYNKYD